MAESRMQRIAEITNSDINMVQETLQMQMTQKQVSKFDNVNVQAPTYSRMYWFLLIKRIYQVQQDYKDCN